jgi:hypothetical protein
MKGGAEIRACRGGPADDELPGLETGALLLREALAIAVAVRRQDEQPSGSEYSAQLLQPRLLGRFGEVREDRDGRDRAEARGLVGQRRVGGVLLEAREQEVLPAPADRTGVAVAAVQVLAVAPVADDPSAAAAEVEQAVLCAVTLERLADGLGGQPAAVEEPLRVGCSGDANPKPRRRQVLRNAAVWTERLQRLVDAERRAERQAQNARLSGRLSSSSSTNECAAQLTSQMITTVPTYVQKPSIEKFGAAHSASRSIAMLITK